MNASKNAKSNICDICGCQLGRLSTSLFMSHLGIETHPIRGQGKGIPKFGILTYTFLFGTALEHQWKRG